MKTLSDKIVRNAHCKVNHIKEFVKELKEAFKDDFEDDYAEKTIDKLAGDKLI